MTIQSFCWTVFAVLVALALWFLVIAKLLR